ncbi:MAG: VCBS repeat-containing protein [Candidatus Kryptonium sp.]|nr:VCBS repeat-containing protein [Candidatus Kryptonium sp.]MCX7761754.1 VCBS repeat-containing protein [Candidatus Kryptonium sp.]MDW8109880.1 VCBS repeat-containing protein [Candidatus Kryptonium sp.]
MPENKELKINRFFLYLFAFYIEILISQNKPFPVFFISEIPLPEGASAFSVGNLNSDNFRDIVAISRRAITCLENNQKREFNFYYSIPIREKPSDVKLEDIDNDGESEIIVVYRANSTIEIFKKDTLGFKKFTSFETGIYPDMLMCSDIDLNGYADLITVGKIMLGITVNYQMAPYEFSTPVNFLPKIPFKKVQIVDLNYDGVPDLAGIDWLNNLLVISYGRGDGRFGLAYNYKLPEEPNEFAVADLDGDGLFDYVISYYYLGEVQFHYTTQVGINSRFRFKISKPSKVSIGDFNGDGFKDVVVSNGEKLYVFFNSKTNFERYEFLSDGTAEIKCVDIDGNGRDDIIALDSVRNRLRIFYSDDKFILSRNFALAVGSSSMDLVVADFNNDGYIDFATVGDSLGLIFAYQNGGEFTVYQNQKNGLFTDVKFSSFLNTNYLFCSNYETGAVSLFRFSDEKKVSEIFKYNFDKPRQIFIGMSADKTIAIFITISDSNLILIKPKGETEFEEISIKEIDSTKVIASTVGDFNNDGYFDVAVINREGENIRLNIFVKAKGSEYIKVYSGNLNKMIKRAFLYTDDFNSDGYQDILAYYDYSETRISDGELNLFLNDGTAKFRERKRIDTHIHLSTSKLLKIGDFSGDYKKDIVVFDKFRDKIYLYAAGDKGFEKKQVYYTSGNKINAIGVADVNHDGFLDLILLNGANGGIEFLINKNGQFE